MSEEVFEPSTGSGDSAGSPHDPDTQPIALPPITPTPAAPVAAVPSDAPIGIPADPPTASYALGALAGNPLLGTPGGTGWSQTPPPPAGPSAGWATPPAEPPATPPRPHRLTRGALAFGASVVLIGAGVGIGHAAWQSPAHLSASSASNRSGTGTIPNGGFASPNGGTESPFGSGNGGGNFGGFGSGSNGSNSSVGAGPSDAASIASKVDPGLVDINTSLGYQNEQAAGTGIVLSSSGEVLTNNHVINGATSISVTDVGNGKTYSAKVVGYDRSKDIAVLQLHGASGLQTANIGDSSKVAVGQQVVGVGNAGGTGGTPSYAGGTVTALNQSITASDAGDGSSEQLTGLIETNANIQAGDSGGSLVNTSGQVVGIDTAASAGFSFQSPQGGSGDQGYAIPINSAVSIAKQIEAGNSSSTIHIGETAFLGVEIQSQAASNGGGSPFGNGNGFGNGSGTQTQSSGAEVAGVVTSSPAQEAGLAQGDVITSVDGSNIGTPDDVTNALEQHHPGDKVTIGWTDASGASHSATVALSSGPPQ